VGQCSGSTIEPLHAALAAKANMWHWEGVAALVAESRQSTLLLSRRRCCCCWSCCWLSWLAGERWEEFFPVSSSCRSAQTSLSCQAWTKILPLSSVVVRGSHQAEGGRPGQCPRNLRRALEVSVSFRRAGRVGIGRLGIRRGETPWWAVRGGVIVVGQLAGGRGAERSCRDVGGERGR